MDRRRFLSGAALIPVAAISACSSSSTSTQTDRSVTTPTAWVTAPPKPLPKNAATPVSMSMPRIDLNQPIVSLGLASNGDLEPPPHTLQWLNSTPIPGKTGNSVIAGHVTWSGKDVFYRLNETQVGDKFSVTYSDKHTQTFQVTRTGSVSKPALRTDQSVWGSSAKPHLVLVTCDDKSQMVGRHYVDNFVVWADPVAH